MRPYLAIGLFALAVVIAACGGGGSGTAPTIPASAAPAVTPLRYASAKLSLKIPAQSAAASSIRRPAYVSPNTQSVQIYVYQAASPSASASPQAFAVAVPPCTRNPDGSKTCTFNVQAPFGEDNFVVKTYAVANPTASSVPLSVFSSGTVDVTSTGTPPPLNFTLTGIVASVAVAMESPNPSLTPSTQIGTIGTAITSSNLLLTPRDASGAAIMTDTFAQPITVNVTPANAGVSLMLTSNSQCTPVSTASGSSASITCASDLNKLAFTYDGTIARNALHAPIDRIAFEGSPQPAGSAAPAYLALSGASKAYTLSIGTLSSVSGVRFVKNTDGHTFTYMIEGFGQTAIGSLDPSNPASSSAMTLGFAASGMTVDSSGNIWVADTYDSSYNPQYDVQCFQGLNTTPAATVQIDTPSSPSPIQPYALTTDTSGNVWFYGLDGGGNAWTGYIPAGACSSPTSTSYAIAQTPYGASGAQPQDAQPKKNGGVYLLDYNNGLYSATTTSSGTLTAIGAAAGQYSESLAVDSNGNGYVAYGSDGGPQPQIAFWPNGGSGYTSTLLMSSGPQPINVSVNTPGSPATFAYGDNWGNFGIGAAASLTHVAEFGLGQQCYGSMFDANNDPWAACWTTNPATNTSNLLLQHFVPTTVWSAAFPSNLAVQPGQTIPLPILESGYSGPYTVSVSDPTMATVASPSPGYENSIPVTFTAGSQSGTFSITITDASGLSQTVPVSWTLAHPSARRRSFAPPWKKRP